jgi:predicted transporter
MTSAWSRVDGRRRDVQKHRSVVMSTPTPMVRVGLVFRVMDSAEYLSQRFFGLQLGKRFGAIFLPFLDFKFEFEFKSNFVH